MVVETSGIWIGRAAALLSVLVLCSCGGGGGATISTVTTTTTTTTSTVAIGVNTAALSRLFKKRGPFAEGTMYECLADALAQGIPYQQALEICETKLLEAGLEEFGEEPFNPLADLPDREKVFDGSKVTGACGTPDAGISGNSTVYTDDKGRDWGTYSWGSGEGMRGLTQAESKAAKEAAIEASLNADAVLYAIERTNKATFEKMQTTNVSNAQALVNALHHLLNAAREAAAKAIVAATKDPNSTTQPTPSTTTTTSTTEPTTTTSPTTTTNPTPTTTPETTPSTTSNPQRGNESSECEEALQQAREFLYECNRTGWKSSECQQLEARMNRCPDPTQILVDPDQGYTCGLTADPLAVASAWKAKCEELKRGVDGTNPCEQPQIDPSFRKVIGNGGFDPCTDPAARVDPESGACAGTLVLPKLGEVDIQQLAVYGLHKFGGPIIVIPKDPRPEGGWSPGPEPRPSPPASTVPNP
jgi:hypothetical protein